MKTGVLVPVGSVTALTSAIIELLGDDEKRVRLATKARQFVAEKFSLERMVKETEEIYRAEL